MSLPVVCCVVVPLFVSLGTVECWGGRQGGYGLELCVRQLRVCGSPLAVCLVSLFVSVCRSCVSSSSVQRPPIPRWCPVRAWLFFTFLPTYLVGCERGFYLFLFLILPARIISEFGGLVPCSRPREVRTGRANALSRKRTVRANDRRELFSARPRSRIGHRST